ncbi:MAG: molybdopterin molybdotransferase MoeA [Sedimentisphaerales bacterium]|nr:molybdopterin molybdotransferase MoeA [Sedimentisphaerales bacterium]
MIEFKQALQIVLDSARPLGSERVDLNQALNRVLAEDVPSDMDMPPFDKSKVDGYACRRADLSRELVVVETIPAGTQPTRQIAPGQCAKIMTGAVVPPGADCVVMIEQTEQTGDGRIRFTTNETPDNIFPKAQDVRQGQVVLPRGARIGPQYVAVLASVGRVRPVVAKLPRVAVVAGGDELVDPGVKPGPSQIRNSNSAQLISQLGAMGIAAHDYGAVKDVAAEVARVLKAAFAENDVVLVSGGVSVGDFDLVPSILKQLGVKLLFEKIAVKPGKPTIFGLAESGYCFGLPGNPVSTFVIFELFVKPFLYRLMGCDYTPVEVQMRLSEPVSRKDTERQEWIPVKIVSREEVRPVEYHGSGHILALCQADGLIRMEIGVSRIEKAEQVSVTLS